jgi:hypothetical protein
MSLKERSVILCSRCDNETRTTALLTPMGEVRVSGPAGSEPLPISAQVCVACGHIDLFAPQSFEHHETVAKQEQPVPIQEFLGGEEPVRA